jgi:hypothetical protein
MRRLLSDLEECPEHALLAIQEGLAAFLRHSDPTAACAHAASGRELARRFGLVDLEMLALAIEGASLVASGELARGMGQLDEATAAALGGEMHQPDLIGLACCFMIYACERVRDFDRAGQWCTRMKAYCDRNGLRSVTAVCRMHYATVLTERGEWRDAETELMTASELLAQRPMLQAEAVARLGELRRRQGRLDEAGALFERVAFHPRAQLGQAALALDRDDPQGAVGWAERFLRQLPEPTGRSAHTGLSCWRVRGRRWTIPPVREQRWPSWRLWRTQCTASRCVRRWRTHPALSMHTAVSLSRPVPGSRMPPITMSAAACPPRRRTQEWRWPQCSGASGKARRPRARSDRLLRRWSGWEPRAPR